MTTPATSPTSVSTVMFANYAAAKSRPLPRYAAPLMAAAVSVVFGMLGSIWIKSMWNIEKLEVQKGMIELAAAPPPPPPPPPPAGARKPQNVEIKPKKIKVKETVQPVKIEKQDEKPVDETPDTGEEGGEEGGEVGGQIGGTVGGDLNGVMGAPPPPPPPPPAAAQNIAPTALEQQRISGEKLITPADVTKTEISRSGKTKLLSSFKICINTGGAVDKVQLLKSSGFPDYDSKIQAEMRNWKYRPFMVNGTAAPVCTAVTFIYTQK